MDFHTRRLRYFVAVAEELHFGRAAARFYIAQQAISRQIRDLEAEMGVVLFERSTRQVALTPPGEVFLYAAREVLAALDDGIHAAKAMGRSAVGVVTVGFRSGAALELTSGILAEMRRAHPGIRVEMRELDFRVPERTHDDERVDVAILRTPFEQPGRRWAPLFSEPRVLAVAAADPLAARESVRVADFAERPVVVAQSRDESWTRYWTVDEERGGPPPSVVLSTSILEEMELVAAGEGCAVTMASACRYMPHPGVTYVPILDAARCEHALVWDPKADSGLARTFVDTALAVRDRETEVVRAIENPY